MTRDAERLAEAIELGTPPGSVAEPGLARDLQIVAMLRTRGSAFDPTPDARARAKARLMAAMVENAPAPPPVAAELTAPISPVRDAPAAATTSEIAPLVDDDPVAPERGAVHAPDVAAARPRRTGRHSLPSRPAGRDAGSRRPAARSARRRVAAIVAASLVALVAIAVGGDLASRSALPGDTLYAFKRTAENVGLAMTFDEQARAQRHLELATARIGEVEQLVARDTSSGLDPVLVEGAIAEFDSSTGEGSRALLAAQDASGPAVLGDLQAWAAEQAARLSVLRSSLPAPAVGEVDSSIALLDRLLGRTEALEARSSCTEVTSSVVDDLGPLAAEGNCTPRVESAPGTSTGGATDSTTPSTSGDAGPGGSDPTGTDGVTPSETPGLLPELGPDGLPLPDGELSTSTSESPDDGDVSIPLPLVPPIQLPPLLPGMPGVTIG
ncbi:MAG: DUF5667 domain-containing protein [Pseudonocardiales bacterium]|nr:DUF5667 domain-containing protein [Pseudonocardiales bacterium]